MLREEIAVTTRRHIPSLDGLRFFAAFFVLLAHYAHWVLQDQGVQNGATDVIQVLSGLGMALFFVLSGFVIHYNYRRISVEPGGTRRFFLARFARLYPLYIVLFIAEFASSFYYHRGSCGHAGERWGYFLALPYYLTLTQDWVYGVICENNLIFQYHMISGVVWSLSAEVFFYIAYAFGTGWLRRQNHLAVLLIVAVAAYLASVGCLLFFRHASAGIEHIASVAFGAVATEQHGYQDSLIFWLNYFNPVINLPAFVCGAVAAQIYCLRADKPMGKKERAYSGPLLLVLLAALIAMHFWFYPVLARTNGFIGRTGSLLYVPLVALVVYGLARYPGSLCSRMIGSRPLVKLGEASYSIYLLHAFFAWNARDYYYLKLNPWLLYAISVTCVLIIARFSYLWFERPAQRWLRRKFNVTPLRAIHPPDI